MHQVSTIYNCSLIQSLKQALWIGSRKILIKLREWTKRSTQLQVWQLLPKRTNRNRKRGISFCMEILQKRRYRLVKDLWKRVPNKVRSKVLIVKPTRREKWRWKYYRKSSFDIFNNKYIIFHQFYRSTS